MKAEIKQSISRMLFLIIIFIIFYCLIIFVHESGHYLVSDYYGLNPVIHIGSDGLSEEYDDIGFVPVYISHEVAEDDSINRKITLSGMYFELILAFLVVFYITVLIFKTGNYKLGLVMIFLMMLIISLLEGYNPFTSIEFSDMYRIIYRK